MWPWPRPLLGSFILYWYYILLPAMDLTEKTRSLWLQQFKKNWFLSTGTPRTADFSSLYQIWRKTVDRRRNYGPKSKSKMAAVHHPGFSKIWKSDFWASGPLVLPIFHHCTKFGAKLLIDAKIMAQNRNPRWRPSAILDLLRHHIGPPTKSFVSWSTSACKILC